MKSVANFGTEATEAVEDVDPIEVVLDPGARIEGRVLAAPEGAVVRAVVAGTSLLDGERFRESAWTPGEREISCMRLYISE